MNRYAKLAVFLCMVLIVSAALATLSACKSRYSDTANNGPQSNVTNNATQFPGLINTDWNLAAVRLDRETIYIDRNANAEFLGDIFTLHFDEERISGVAAPNRYFAPYTLADNQAVSIGNIANTLMAAFLELEELKEHEFLTYLQDTYRWNLADGNLELHSKSESGTDVVLIFAPN